MTDNPEVEIVGKAEREAQRANDQAEVRVRKIQNGFMVRARRQWAYCADKSALHNAIDEAFPS